ncbi:hypothetical protein [Pseudoduganella chitinolytica]|uniref:CPBP family intramembrane metalloprotease n=1 Tax=Pseudoduganella chitinolytica TaxID=34070 RepID=A0ABY8B638_9BURK|nr:hypothetical protein [Pseudoduganella chitinolytica]WEF31394.1 hypothetical protein PX653_18245 [Pseudoduganella chitinolytica]
MLARPSGAALALSVPVALAWAVAFCAQRLGTRQGTEAVTAVGSSLGRVLLWGPLYETVLLLAAAAALARLLARDHAAAGLICLAFLSSHVAQRGGIALLSLPMAWLLSLGAVRAVRQRCPRSRAWQVGLLFLVHAWYNAALLWFSA